MILKRYNVLQASDATVVPLLMSSSSWFSMTEVVRWAVYMPFPAAAAAAAEPSEARLRFLNEVKAAVRASARKELVVFVHGYNVNFEACMKSAAQVCAHVDAQPACTQQQATAACNLLRW
jgi:esterase/lipase superfamily enzyme